MIEPKSIREITFVVDGLAAQLDSVKTSIETRLDDLKQNFDARLGLVQRLVWIVFGLLGTLVGGAASLYVQIGDIKSDVAGIKANLIANGERIGKIEKVLEDLRTDSSQIQRTLARIESRLASADPQMPMPALPALTLSASETQTLREALQARAQITTSRPTDPPNRPDYQPLPENVTRKIHRLKGLQYGIVSDGSIVLFDPARKRIVGAVPADTTARPAATSAAAPSPAQVRPPRRLEPAVAVTPPN